MAEKSSHLSRRKFMLAGSAAVASPLLLTVAGSMAASKSAEAKTAGTDFPKGTKVYYIKEGCLGCQVCKTFCPAQAIHFGDCRNEIDQSKCIHCGTCYRECNISIISETVVS